LTCPLELGLLKARLDGLFGILTGVSIEKTAKFVRQYADNTPKPGFNHYG
jgi:hypothetical protein